MTRLPEDLLPFLPAGTAATWEAIAAVVPRSAYLGGGSALIAHLKHRVSDDLDFFLEHPEDLVALRAALAALGPLVVTYADSRTLNCVLDRTKLQFLDVSDERIQAPFIEVGGLRIASVEDIAAMKLNALVGRAELRDYFDLMELDRRRVVPVEEAFDLFSLRYRPKNSEHHQQLIVRALGYLEDVATDDSLPVRHSEIAKYWARRQPEVVAALALGP